MSSETEEQELKVTYLAPLDENGIALEPPYSVGWLDTLTFVKQMVTGVMMPDPITRERCIWDHGEIQCEDGSRLYFHWDSDGNTLVWEEEETPPTDKVCEKCNGTGRDIVDGVLVEGTRCLPCSGTGRVVA